MAATRVIVFLLYLFALCCNLASADEYALSPTGIDDPTNSCNTANPCRTLEYLMSIATPSSTIDIAAGNYTLDSPSKSIDISNFYIRHVGSPVVFSCSSNYTSTSSNPFTASIIASMIGFTFQNCPVPVFQASSGLTLLSCTFSGNNGAVVGSGASVSMQNCVYSSSQGASVPAIQLQQSTLQLEQCSFSNVATTATTGAALDLTTVTATVSDTAFYSTEASAPMVSFSANSVVTLNNVSIAANLAQGMSVLDSRVSMVGSQIVDNTAQAGSEGGGIYASGSTLNINSSSIENNHASNAGGLYLTTSSGTFSQVTISGNSAEDAVQGIYLDGEFEFINGIVEDVVYSAASASTVRMLATQVTTEDAPFAFCCGASFDQLNVSVDAQVCYYPACNPTECTGAAGCICPDSVFAESDTSASAADVCDCPSGDFSGPYCTEFNCSAGDLASCNFAGHCAATGCECFDTFYGVRCDTYCERVGSCSGNGNCNAEGQCVCDTGFFGDDCSGGRAPPTPKPSSAPTVPPTFTPTTGTVITGSCPLSPVIVPRLYASWQENSTFYQIFDIVLRNNGPSSVTGVTVTLANATMIQNWNLMDITTNETASGEYTYSISLDAIAPFQSSAAVGFVNAGYVVPTIISISCDATDNNPIATCNGVQIHSNVLNSFYDGNINSIYDLFVTNAGDSPVTELNIQITTTDGTKVINAVNLTQVDQNNEYSVPVGKHLDVGQSLYGFSFTLVGAGSASVSCAHSEITSPNKISKGGLSRRHKGAIAGGVIGGVILIALIIVLIFFLTRRRRHMVEVPSFERTSVHKKPKFGIEHFGDGYDNPNPSAADQNL